MATIVSTVLAGALAVVVVAVPRSAAATRKPVCGPAMARTTASTDRLRILRVDRGIEVVCSKYSRRRWTLEPPYDDICWSSQGCGGRTHLKVAGRWVLQVFEQSGGPHGDLYADLFVRAAGSRRIARVVRIGDPGPTTAVTQNVVLDRRGGAGWISRHLTQSDQAGSRLTVERLPGCGPTVADSGSDIDARSLRLAGSTVSWMRGGETKAAAACPLER